jgi:hypothetical protein
MQLVILWFLESALSAVRLETALGMLPLLGLWVNHVSLDNTAKHTGTYPDRYNLASARVDKWNSSKKVTTVLYFTPELRLSTPHTGGTRNH